MSALAGKEILKVDGTGERGFIVTYRDGMDATCKALVPPVENHPDFIAAHAFSTGIPIPGAPSKACEDSFWNRY